MKNYLIHFGVIIFFFLCTAFYFSPAVFSNKVLEQGDMEKAEGMTKELTDYAEKEDGHSAWTGSMFSGMPSYSIGTPNGPGSYLYHTFFKVFSFFGGQPAGVVLLSLVLTYLFFIGLDFSKPIAVLGSIAYSFSSYFLIIIVAGHMWKAWAMAYMPFVLMGLFLLFKGKKLVGTFIFSMALALELKANHMQITYYLAFLCAFISIAFAIICICNKQIKQLLLVAGLAVVGAFFAVLQNADGLISNYELSQTSIRGKSRLTSKVDGKNDKSSGLDQDYAFAWSYGVGETMTILIPDFYGGASGGELDAKHSHLAEAYRDNGAQVPSTLRTATYFGDQPFTSGPVYFGAIICFLFVLALFIVDSKYKWWIVAATAFFVVLSWGKNCPVNNFFFHYLPMYNKFRTPSMALVIPQITFALMACMALKKIASQTIDNQKLMKFVYISAGITGGLCLIFWLVPGMFMSFTSSLDGQQLQGVPEWYMNALIEDRSDLVSSDSLRSLIYILLGTGIIWFIARMKDNKYTQMGIAAIAVLTLFDLWSVDRRYLNDDNFVKRTRFEANPFQMNVADQAILEDKDPSYRVLTFNNPFNDTHVSYFHKSIGGYNAAKLRDYQDLIDHEVEPEMQYISKSLSHVRMLQTGEIYQPDADSVFKNIPVLNMLNMRYLIYNDASLPIKNNMAYGNAWFVKDVKVANTADDEMLALKQNDLKSTVIVSKEDKNAAGLKTGNVDANASVVLTTYKPDTLKYAAKSATGGVVVFSEIYYQPGWKAFIDGKEVPHFRADWILRGIQVPAGNHEIVFAFYPQTYWTFRYIDCYLSIIFLVVLVGGIGFYFYKNRKNGEETEKHDEATASQNELFDI